MEERQTSLVVEVRDGERPTWLKEKILEYKPTSVSQVINLFLHFTMTECGFQCRGGGTYLRPGWQNSITAFHYTLRLFPVFQCSLALKDYPKTGVKQISAHFPEQEVNQDYIINVVMKDYIKDTTHTPIICEDLVNVSQLAKTLKGKLIFPFQFSGHEILDFPSTLAPWHLTELPDDLLIMIESLIDCNRGNVVALRGACHILWRSMYKRNLRNVYDDD
ncbi:hypothetical protein Pmani_035445 [Petrolisthes manimaculis]|uniref:Uncharacterized protein n=1 Tax=Petrolisthes manimaculis TaxID=1843537 RepID=A0AAE1NME9_9EUCA|nr:hypothetical protein Pmani_035445 [Petrolisthes manimaculis]